MVLYQLTLTFNYSVTLSDSFLQSKETFKNLFKWTVKFKLSLVISVIQQRFRYE